ncbi:hypothetical protein B4907_16390 [Yersinia kristensenii]|nr:hypothetical protein B4907_16390 [Yersinia kristensenii]
MTNNLSEILKSESLILGAEVDKSALNVGDNMRRLALFFDKDNASPNFISRDTSNIKNLANISNVPRMNTIINNVMKRRNNPTSSLFQLSGKDMNGINDNAVTKRFFLSLEAERVNHFL